MKIKFPAKVFLIIFFAFVSAASAQIPKTNFNRSRTYDVQHYIIRLSFDRAARRVFGDTTVQLKPLQNDFKQLELDAAQMNFESVKLEPSGTDLQFRQAGEKIIITLDKNYSPNDSISVRLKYTTNPAKGIYFAEERVDEGKVFHSAQIWTQNEPERAHFWFPSYDFPDDKATSEEFITVEKDETAIGNGDLRETVENADGTKTFHYKMPVRHATYVTSFVVGKYVKVTDSYKKIPLTFYVYPGSEAIAQRAFGKTKEMMRIYEELTGIDFPFNKYDQTIVGNFEEFSAMENVTATTLSDRDVFMAQFDGTQGLVEDVVSHELAHSWFGNLVTCRNWAELWLNEGFATFMEAAYREKMYGREQYLEAINEDALEHFSEDLPRAKRHGLYNLLAKPDDSIFDTTAYQKGGAVIHTLRETIGDKAFWKAINSYLKRHQFENVETADLKKAMEDASGQNLDWFFAQWVYGAGYPKLEIEPVFYEKAKTLTLRIRQTQNADELVPAAFIMPFDVEVTTESGAKTETIRINKREQVFSIKVDGQPKNLDFDKNLKIPLKTVKVKPLETSEK
ncbi:MAG TPA: M1 family metallopeptidase [Pyrinomonadaceae bacterium]|jgi:aminopeptidase N